MFKKVTLQIFDEFKAFWRNLPAAVFTFALLLVLLLIELTLFSHSYLTIGTARVKASDYLVPSISAFGIIGTTFTTLAMILTSRKHIGVLKKISRSPIAPWVYLSGLIGTSVINAILMLIICILVGLPYGFNPTTINYFQLSIWFVVGIFCFSSLGLGLSTFFSNPQQATGLVNLVLLPLAFLSGVFNPAIQNQLLNKALNYLPVKPFIDAILLTTQHSSALKAALNFSQLQGLLVLLFWFVLSCVVFLKRFRVTN